MIGRSALIVLAASLLPGCGDTDQHPSGLRFVGLEDGDCTTAKQALFGKVPLVLEHVGAGELTRVAVTVNGGSPMEDSEPPFQLQLDTTQLTDGAAKLEATGTDGSGESVTAAIQVCVDNNAPDLTVLSPDEGTAIGIEDAALTVRARASDPSGVESVVAQIDVGGAHQEVTCTPPGAQEVSCALKPGDLGLVLTPNSDSTLVLTVTARDKRGREASVNRELSVSTRLLWSYHAGAAISWAVAVGPGGSVAVGTDVGGIHVVDAGGNKICSWTAPPVGGKAEGVAAPLTLSDDGTRLFFATTQRFHGLNPATCTPLWPPQSGLFYASQPAYDPGSGVVYIGTYGTITTKGSLLAIGAGGGQLVGSFPLTDVVNEAVTGSPALSADNKTVYIGSSNFKLYAVDATDPASMKLSWSYPTGGKVETKPLVTPGRIYLSSRDKAIHAIDPGTGQKIPEFNFTAKAGFLSGPVFGTESGLLYAGSLDLQLYAVDFTGKVAASYETGRMMYSSPAIGPGGTVFAVQTLPGRIYALTPKLQLLWSIQPGTEKDQLKGSPVVSGQTVYIGSTNGFLYALDASPGS
jgi:outer membrane protein assembly factor BamB